MTESIINGLRHHCLSSSTDLFFTVTFLSTFLPQHSAVAVTHSAVSISCTSLCTKKIRKKRGLVLWDSSFLVWFSPSSDRTFAWLSSYCSCTNSVSRCNDRRDVKNGKQRKKWGFVLYMSCSLSLRLVSMHVVKRFKKLQPLCPCYFPKVSTYWIEY